MNVWTLTYPIPYEGGYFLGVFSTETDARDAAIKHSNTIPYPYYLDSYKVTEIQVGKLLDNDSEVF